MKIVPGGAVGFGRMALIGSSGPYFSKLKPENGSS
jgi:hypothetical protein